MEQLLPPKKQDIDPQSELVEEARFEQCDIEEIRARSFPAGHGFFDHNSQFDDDDDWVDEDEDDHLGDNDYGPQPECRQQ